MKVEIITIGDEILIGQIVDTNSAWMAQILNHNGLRISRITTVGDSYDDIITALNSAKNDSDITLITGGLGPTKDDITKNALCEYFNSKLVYNESIFRHIEQFIIGRGNVFNELNRSQAMVPDNCTPLPNDLGTAPGLWFENKGKIIISLPGVPYEMKALMEKHVLPMIISKFKMHTVYHRTLSTIDISEANLADLLDHFEKKLPVDIKMAYLPSPGIVRLRLSGYGEDSNKINISIDQFFSELVSLIPEYVYGYESETIQEVIGKLLKDKKLTLSTAESCTGGNIAHLITLVPGSSEYFSGSVVAYSNEIKNQILGVSNEKLIKNGAVSQSVVEEMAIGINRLLGSDYSIATSGIAGPTGGTIEKPVGMVWVAIANKEKVISKKFLVGENRERNIEKASLYGLNMLRQEIIKNS